MSAFRTIGQLRASGVVSADELPRISGCVAGSAVVIVLIAVVTRSFAPFYAIALCCGHVFFSHNIAAILRRWRMRLFERHKIVLLNQILLRMKTGHALRTAFFEIRTRVEREKSPMAPLLHKIQQVLDLRDVPESLESLPSLCEFARELLGAEQSSQHALVRVENLRLLYKKRLDFRQRSGQVLTQIRAQTFVLVGLYLALSVFTAIEFGAHQFMELRIISAVFFVMGVLMVFYLGRRVRWKV